ncbi:TM0106 family RecB-like putative nuclease [Corynebacterium cystitidis]|uniref:TM0106 family RecB-like putative nuclease n=1 Tax=Corynebacterium cystitidis TaxID=35757 RepID=UPI00211E4E2B|nr:TM0106 family RecB-like putative nuclease [Corynebacterium cystitidis]
MTQHKKYSSQRALGTPETQGVRASDLVGCRYRLRQRLDHPEIGPTDSGQARAERMHAARAVVYAALPTKPALGDGRRTFTRVDLARDSEDPEPATREALRKRAHLITNARLSGRIDDHLVTVHIDVLVRTSANTYQPVMVSNHRVARPSETSTMQAVSTTRLGLGSLITVQAQQRHHTVDGYRIALAALLLAQLGVADPLAGVVGQDRSLAYFAPVAPYIKAVREALAQPTPTAPIRLKQCATCRFWQLCEPELRAADEISLVFPGQRAAPFRERGIHTVAGAITAGLGEPSAVAHAWRENIPVLARTDSPEVPRADVEIDIDMEAYLDQGAYLWGAYDGDTYHSFVTWEEVGGAAESHNFTQFWQWLMGVRRQAHEAGLTFCAYCYAAGGENHWLRASARRFDTVEQAEVNAFIASDEWVDVFAHVRRDLVGVDGLGLKVVAPVAGYDWEDNIDGEASIALRRRARLGDQSAREVLLRYNEDDCRATRAVRDFLDAGAPGLPRVHEF